MSFTPAGAAHCACFETPIWLGADQLPSPAGRTKEVALCPSLAPSALRQSGCMYSGLAWCAHSGTVDGSCAGRSLSGVETAERTLLHADGLCSEHRAHRRAAAAAGVLLRLVR